MRVINNIHYESMVHGAWGVFCSLFLIFVSILLICLIVCLMVSVFSSNKTSRRLKLSNSFRFHEIHKIIWFSRCNLSGGRKDCTNIKPIANNVDITVNTKTVTYTYEVLALQCIPLWFCPNFARILSSICHALPRQNMYRFLILASVCFLSRIEYIHFVSKDPKRWWVFHSNRLIFHPPEDGQSGLWMEVFQKLIMNEMQMQMLIHVIVLVSSLAWSKFRKAMQTSKFA